MAGPEKTAIELPDIPSQPTELEDAAAALFQASGHFVERNIIERDATEILEMDAVATSYDGDRPESVIAEAKSGDWGYADIFKLHGWMHYLGIPRGALFVTRVSEGKEIAKVREKIGGLGMTVIRLDSPDLAAHFVEAGYPACCNSAAIDVWRFAYSVQRTLIAYLRHCKKTAPDHEGPATALRYHTLINNEIFFERDLRVRLARLYAAFMEHPKLSLGVALEMDGGAFDCEADDQKNVRISQAMRYGSHEVIQACFYIEHRARLAILKIATDLCLCETPPKAVLKSGGRVVFTQDDFLPATFRAGLQELKTHKYFKRYPVFWQVFLWGFGGFYLNDRKDQEFEWLAEETGVPVEEIPNALKAFDLLFPMAKSWLTPLPHSQCVIVKMVPTPVQGLGAYYRELRYGVKSYDELGYTDMTTQDLSRRHNKGYELLKMRETLKRSSRRAGRSTLWTWTSRQTCSCTASLTSRRTT